MPTEQFANNAQTTLASAITAGTSPISVASSAGFPGSAQFRIRIDDEILLVTAGAGTTSWAVSRGQESTSAAAHASGAAVTHVLTAGALQNLDAGVIASGTLPIARGGTGAGGKTAALNNLSPLAAKGDVLTSDGTNNVALGVGGDGQVLTADSSQSAGLKWANSTGGMSNPMTTLGDLIYENATPAAARLPGNTAATKKFLTQTGTGTTSAAPAWGTLGTSDLPALNGLSAADPAFSDALVVNKSGTNNTETVQRLGGFLRPSTWELRLTFTSGAPVTTGDVVTSAAQIVYATPLVTGNRGCLFDGTRWLEYTLAEMSLPLQQSLSGTTVNASTTLTLASGANAQLVRGMTVGGPGILAGTTISAIPTATTVTLSAAATLGATNTITFKLPANTNYDVFALDNSGSPTLRLGNAWSGDTTRADALGTQDNVQVNNAAVNSGDVNSIGAKLGRYLGTLRTVLDGQGEDSMARRLCWNQYHRRVRSMKVVETTSSYNYSTASWRRTNGNASSNFIEVVIGLSEDEVVATARSITGSTAAANVATGVGIDQDGTNAAYTFGAVVSAGGFANHTAEYRGFPGVGYHQLRWLEIAYVSGTQTWYGSGFAAQFSGGLTAAVVG